MAGPPDETSRADVISLLAGTLGEEKGAAAFEEAAKSLGLSGRGTLRRTEVLAVLDLLGQGADLVGVAARYARLRFGRIEAHPKPDSEAPPAIGATPPSSGKPASSSGTGPSSPRGPVEEELVRLFAASLGEEKAREAIAHVAGVLRLEGDTLTREGAIAILDHMAASPGLLGITARFGKARFLLRFE